MNNPRIGWIGVGRMGYPMAERLIRAGHKLSVYNRTRAKAEGLGAQGATIVPAAGDLAACDIVFTMVSTTADLKAVLFGPGGLVAAGGKPGLVVDASTISLEGSVEVRRELEGSGIEFLATPVSGNGKCVRAGKLAMVASGPRAAYDRVAPLLDIIAGQGSSYVGEGDLSRIVKICHNLLLGVTIQTLVEILVLAETAGIRRADLMDFINKSVMGSTFSKYKSPALVNLDYTPTFTPILLRKDLDLGLAAGSALGVPLPVTAATREVLQAHIGAGRALGLSYAEQDFAALLDSEARGAGIRLSPETVKVDDGLAPSSGKAAA